MYHEKYHPPSNDPPSVSFSSQSSQTDINNAVLIFPSPDSGIEVMPTKDYGIGIDCHSKFLEINILVKRDAKYFEFCHESSTDWESLKESKNWAVQILLTCSDPPIQLSEPLHYCIESTSTYHLPVLLAWEGTPSVVNPSIAGSTKRKTDKLDARLLAIHDLTGVWRPSYVVPSNIQDLRVLISQREYHSRNATRIGNRINSTLLKFGYTVSRDGSVTKNEEIRNTVENLLSNHPTISFPHLPPTGIPQNAKIVLKKSYHEYDENINLVDQYTKQIHDCAFNMDWPIGYGKNMPGKELIPILMTAPGIGEVAAITWLAHIMDPTRFPNAKALAAYCSLDPSLRISAQHVTSTKKRKGNKDLHFALCHSASIIIGYHNEHLGRWGYRLYQQTGKWKKATNAVARRLSIALYHMHKRAEPFSYDKYQFSDDISVLPISLNELIQINTSFRRYISILNSMDIYDTESLVKAYYSCKLKDCKGLGPKFYTLLREFIDNQDNYLKLYQNHLSQK